MDTQLQHEMPTRDVELADTCLSCGGVVRARFTPGSARGVCLTCHLITPMAMVRQGEGIRVVQWPIGLA